MKFSFKTICYLILKRLIDIIGGFIGVILSLPIVIYAIIQIRKESPGPAIFKQQRVGLNGKIFTIYKLRGMYVDAKERFPKLYDYSQKQSLNFYFHDKNDPRVTKVGRFIRKTSIDELPNFINVLIGSMSLVGPRPEIKEVIPLYGKNAAKYLSVKPGITCFSKADLRDSLTKEETLKLDLNYIDNMSLLVDLKLIFKTIKNVFFRKNVYT
jgi:lipopolysaccharide/colanic/teichoic acid biosynthesis glycosyltransferase